MILTTPWCSYAPLSCWIDIACFDPLSVGFGRPSLDEDAQKESYGKPSPSLARIVSVATFEQGVTHLLPQTPRTNQQARATTYAVQAKRSETAQTRRLTGSSPSCTESPPMPCQANWGIPLFSAQCQKCKVPDKPGTQGQAKTRRTTRGRGDGDEQSVSHPIWGSSSIELSKFGYVTRDPSAASYWLPPTSSLPHPFSSLMAPCLAPSLQGLARAGPSRI